MKDLFAAIDWSRDFGWVAYIFVNKYLHKKSRGLKYGDPGGHYIICLFYLSNVCKNLKIVAQIELSVEEFHYLEHKRFFGNVIIIFWYCCRTVPDWNLSSWFISETNVQHLQQIWFHNRFFSFLLYIYDHKWGRLTLEGICGVVTVSYLTYIRILQIYFHYYRQSVVVFIFILWEVSLPV